MTRALVSLCALVMLVGAGPKYDRPASTSTDPDLLAAEVLWQAAEREQDPRRAGEAWERAAAGFTKVVDAKKATTAERKEAAYAAVLAWKNALNVDPRIKAPTDRDLDADRTRPVPVPAREQAMLRAFDAYLAFSPPVDEAVGMQFLRANVLRRYGHFDEAIPVFAAILADHRDHEVAEYAANLLLDSYNLLARYDDLIALAEQLRADNAFLADKPDLARTVAQIHKISARKGAEALEKRARATGDLSVYEQCGDAYLALAGGSRKQKGEPDHDEELYNAMVCYESAGSVARASAIGRELLATYPSSRLAARVLGRIAVGEAAVANYAAAATALEQYVRQYPSERDAMEAASDAVFYLTSLGSFARAAKVSDVILANAKDPAARRQVLLGAASLLPKMVEAGQRKPALARARVLAKRIASASGSLGSADPWGLLQAGRGLAAASCPVTTVDELCPRGRDKAVIAAARRLLGMAEHGATRDDPSTGAAADLAALALLDLDLEGVLATKKPAAAAAAQIAADYRSLIDPDTQPYVTVAARARLGQLARRQGDDTGALAHFRECVAVARDARAGDPWIEACERGLAALKSPDADLLPEHLVPASSLPPMSTEGASR